ncbi:Predicted N-acyltransferase, GNAT family [Methylobacillus rhizosphaerae]|uniref:Predicted N-acyltransferase, GNAT family n=1 Tax=Methylobacillus rhizosphaerae TaxID=551994 RepID=A0A238XSM5_9PROT|nr:GNAT family N-acetyltransferase [Methylobacillus rhizosphaerae]SNR61995.1 Predicted N-acyltransferase, GNAT family [Methylobacillus rhizosphaerae]
MHFYVREADWVTEQASIAAIRSQVFIEEQHVPPELEWDGLDESALHLLAMAEDGQVMGCARVLSDGGIGRMAVLVSWRQQGVGRALLQAAISACQRHGWLDIHLSAQTHAVVFYEKAGFEVISDEYMDAGIPHKAMKLHV